MSCRTIVRVLYLAVMRYLIGTDEAGYGPNLGPLVISATVWEVPDDVQNEGLFDHLCHAVAPSPDRTLGLPDPRVIMADSKTLYASGKGLRRLELGLWAALESLGHRPRTWREVWHALAPEAVEGLDAIPWYAEFAAGAPMDCWPVDLAAAATVFRDGLAAAGVRLAAVRSRVIFAEEFNAMVDRDGSKGVVLSNATLALAARMIEPLPSASIRVVCDKHGGRNRYAPVLGDHFPDHFIEIHGEGRERSVYRLGPAERRIEFCFRTRAESCLAAALASMASKYLREMAMHAFNDFWRQRVPDLQPTAGYPEDAKRFRADIAETQRRLKIHDRVLWRNR